GDIRSQIYRRISCAIIAVLVQTENPTPACNPEFPNTLLDQGDDAVLIAPVTDFYSELESMKLAPSRFQAVPVEGGETPASYAAQAEQAEANDLRAALKKSKVKEEEVDHICAAHALMRSKLEKF